LPKHSPRFGQLASSQTVCRLFARKAALIRATSGVADDLARIHDGLRNGVTVGSILIGMRAIFSAPRSFSPWTIGAGRGLGSESGVELIALVYSPFHVPPSPSGDALHRNSGRNRSVGIVGLPAEGHSTDLFTEKDYDHEKASPFGVDRGHGCGRPDGVLARQDQGGQHVLR